MNAKEALRAQMINEINKGRLVRSEYGSAAGIPTDTLIRNDIKPSIAYVGQKGAVSTDEPVVEPIGTTSGSLDLMRGPIYEELLKELRAQQLRDSFKSN